MAQNIIVVGLGKFGEKVLDIFSSLMDDRKEMMGEEIRKSANIWLLKFSGEKNFDFKNIASSVKDCLKGSSALNFNEEFSYIFLGDIADEHTALYALDYAFIPFLLNNNGMVKKSQVTGFFTFSDELGDLEENSSGTMALILNFFKQFTDIVKKQEYCPPFHDANGKKFDPIFCPTGPFDKNYVMITPGDEEIVDSQTTMVFAERLFYEIFYLHGNQESNAYFTLRNQMPENAFSSFSMIEVERLKDLQEFFLIYSLEKRIISCLLERPTEKKSLDYYEKGFIRMMDVGSDDEFVTESEVGNDDAESKGGFPMSRAVNLFFKKHKNEFKILDFEVALEAEDVRDYIGECRKRLNDKVSELRPEYDRFASEGIDSLLETMEDGFTELLKIKNLTGNLSTFIRFIDIFRSRIASWEDNLREICTEEPDETLEKRLEEIEDKINEVKNAPVYKFPLFKPIKKAIINALLKSLPLKIFLRQEIRVKLAKSFLEYFKDTDSAEKHPVRFCDERIRDLEEIRRRLGAREKQLEKKISMIENINSQYYVISELDDDSYRAILKRIQDQNFGLSSTSKIEGIASSLFAVWTSENGRTKKFTEVFENPEKLISYITEYSLRNISDFTNLETDRERFKLFADTASEKMTMSAKGLSEKSFRINDASSYLSESQIILGYGIEGKESDRIDMNLIQKHPKGKINKTITTHHFVPREFTLGATVFFHDYLFMKEESLARYQRLMEYVGEKIPEKKFVDSDKTSVEKKSEVPVQDAEKKSTGLSDSELSGENRFTRYLLTEYCRPEFRAMLFKMKLSLDGPEFSDEEINALSVAISPKEVMDMLSDDQLHDLAREINVQVTPSHERQTSLILNYISENME